MQYLAGSIATVVSVIMVFAYLIVRMALRHEERRMKFKETMAQGNAGALFQTHEDEIQKLKSRVAVLERLLTDEDRRVANEINRLNPTIARSDRP